LPLLNHSDQLKGYGTIVASHFELRERLQAARRTSGSGFDPPRNSLSLTSYRFKLRAMNLVVPKSYLKLHRR